MVVLTVVLAIVGQMWTIPIHSDSREVLLLLRTSLQGNSMYLQLESESIGEPIWSPDGQDIYVTSSQGIWHFDPHDLATSPQLFDMYFAPLALSPDNYTAASLNADGAIVLWDRHTGELIDIFYDPGQSLRKFDSLAFSPDETRLAMGISGTSNVRPDGALAVWGVQEQEEIVFIREVVSPVEVVFDQTGEYVITGGYIGLTLHETETWNTLSTPPGSAVQNPGMSIDGRWLAYWDWRAQASVIIDIHTRETLTCELRAGVDSVSFSPGDVAFSPQIPNVIAISHNNYLGLWDLEECELVDFVSSPIFRLAFHPHGAYIAGTDGIDLYIYDAESLEEVARTPDNWSILALSR